MLHVNSNNVDVPCFCRLFMPMFYCCMLTLRKGNIRVTIFFDTISYGPECADAYRFSEREV